MALMLLAQPPKYDFDASIVISAFRRCVRSDRIGICSSFRDDAAGISQGSDNNRPGRLGACRGELVVGRELDRLDGLIISISNDLYRALLDFECLSDPFQQTDVVGGHRGATGREHAAITDPHDRHRSVPEHDDKALIDFRLQKNIQRFRETEILFQQSIEQHKKKLLAYRGKEIHIPVLKLLKTVPLVTVLHEVIKEFGFTAHQTEEAIALLKSETGKYIQSATHRIIKNRAWLIISPIDSLEVNHFLMEAKDNEIVFSGGVLSMEIVNFGSFKMTADPQVAQLDLSKITFPLLLRKWKIGDYFYPLGMQKKKKVSRFLSDQKLSLTQKENVWVVAMDQKIIWVVGMRIDDRYKISEATQQIYSLRLLKSS